MLPSNYPHGDPAADETYLEKIEAAEEISER